MKLRIVLLLFSGVFVLGSAFGSDTDVGKITKSELADQLIFDMQTLVATLPEVYTPAFNAPVALQRLPISKGTEVMPAKVVHPYRRARDAL